MHAPVLVALTGLSLQWVLIVSSILMRDQEPCGGLLVKGITFLLFIKGLDSVLSKLKQLPERRSLVIFFRRLADLFAAILLGDRIYSRAVGVLVATILCAWIAVQVVRLAKLQNTDRVVDWSYYL